MKIVYNKIMRIYRLIAFALTQRNLKQTRNLKIIIKRDQCKTNKIFREIYIQRRSRGMHKKRLAYVVTVVK